MEIETKDSGAAVYSVRCFPKNLVIDKLFLK